MNVPAALALPVFGAPRGRHAKPRPVWKRGVARTLLCAFTLLAANVTRLRSAHRTIETIFREELGGTARESVPEKDDVVEIS